MESVIVGISFDFDLLGRFASSIVSAKESQGAMFARLSMI